jgi:hypothetical protein
MVECPASLRPAVRLTLNQLGRGGDPRRPDRRRIPRTSLASGRKRDVDLLDRPEHGKAFGDY